jgi:hypothetical protein
VIRSRPQIVSKLSVERKAEVSMLYAYILISLAMLVTGVALLVQIFMRVKEPLMQMFLGVISIGLIACAVGVFLAAPH